MAKLYTDNANFGNAKVLCTDAQLTQYAPTGYYSINGKYRYWFYYANRHFFPTPAFKCPR